MTSLRRRLRSLLGRPCVLCAAGRFNECPDARRVMDMVPPHTLAGLSKADLDEIVDGYERLGR